MARLFVIKPSSVFVSLLFAVHGLAITSICLTSLPLWARAGITLLIVASLIHHLYLHLRSPLGWQSFFLDGMRVAVSLKGGAEWQGDVTRQTVITSSCVVLCVRLDRGVRVVRQVIFFDAMQADAFRELRVRLRFP